MPSAIDRPDDRTHDDAAGRMARRIDRDLRLRTRRRRAALLAVSIATVLLVGGLSVAMARGGLSADSSGSQARQAAVIPATQASAVASSESSTKAAQDPTSSVEVVRPRTPIVAVRKAQAQKVPAKRTAAPVKQTPRAIAAGPGILIRKCAGSGCHSASEVSGGGLDVQSAQGAIQAMTDGGYVDLTSAERTAVITALTRK